MHNAAYYYGIASEHPPLSLGEERSLMAVINGNGLATDESRAAVEKIVRHNLSLAIRMANKVTRRRRIFGDVGDDAISVAVTALFEAARGATDVGKPFAHYASIVIRRDLIEFQRRMPVIVVSRYAKRRLKEKKKGTNKVRYDVMVSAQEAAATAISMDVEIDGKDLTGHEVIVDEQKLVSEDVGDSMALSEGLSILSDRDREVIEAIYGIGRPPETNVEIGRRLGISPQRTGQIHDQSLTKMRAFLGSTEACGLLP